MELLLKYILTDKGLFAALIGAIIGGIFAIIGSLIGGVFTYLAVILTFKNQEKNEIPKKIIMITRISSDIGVYIKELDLKSGFDYDSLDLESFRGNLLIKSADVDKECYRMILNAFYEITIRGFDRIFIDHQYFTNDEFDQLVEGYRRELSLLKRKIDYRLKYYEQKI
jgi:hypothetical protein